MKNWRTDKIDVTGLSINDIMNIDLDTFNKLSESALRSITSRLVSASNKRIRNLTRKGIYSPAINSLGTRTAFSTKLPKDVAKNQRINKLRQEFAKARNFLTMKTSTITGAKQYNKQVITTIEKQIGRKLTTNESITRVHNLFHKAQESGYFPSGEIDSLGSKQARKYMFDVMSEYPNLSEQEIIDKVEKQYKTWNEHRELKKNEDETEETEIDS